MRDLAWMLLAAVAEVLGCYAIWLWVRADRSAWLVVPGLGSLAVFGWALAQVPMSYAGRTFAAYGGVYIVVSVALLLVVERAAPSRWDWVGVGLCLAGAGVLVMGRR
ncbi:MAG: YnfA family protein [Gemmatimonadetes bacterium]|nr:YnfA family protein [Gemmatimonadota bacterium]